jgi:hypothetical protein
MFPLGRANQEAQKLDRFFSAIHIRRIGQLPPENKPPSTRPPGIYLNTETLLG